MSKKKKAKDIEKLKDQFFSNVTHEFRTPLTLILGPVEQLLRNEYDAQTQQRLLMIQRNALQLQKLIDELLDISKIENEKVTMAVFNADFARFAHDLFESFRPIAEDKALRLVWEGPSSGMLVFYDGAKWKKVLYNLISNAIKFTDGGGAVTARLKEEDNQIQFTITDTGIGIVESKIPHVFDRFYQEDPTHVRLYQGTGIGLALVKELVELNNGTIEVSSVKYQGSTFTVRFPAYRRESELPPNWPVIPPEAELLTSNTETQRHSTDVYPIVDTQTKEGEHPVVLVVEDNNEMRPFIKSILTNEYEVITAQNGEEGLQLALEQVPDLILSDVNMPKLDGFEMLHLLRKEEVASHIPVIFLTARDSEIDRIQGRQEGAESYITKPFNSEELLLVVKNMLAHRDRLFEYFKTQFVFEEVNGNKPLSREESFLLRIQKIVDTSMDDPLFSVETLSKELFMSRTQVHRKLKALTNTSTSIYVRNYKLEKARKMILESDDSITEIAYKHGFSSPAYFSKCFSEFFGESPSGIKSRDLPK